MRQNKRNKYLKDFAALILTHGRPDRVRTYNTLRRHGYTGPIYLLVDNLDKTIDQYRELFGDQVIVFDKPAIAKTFDAADNFNDMRAIVYARNASFKVAKTLGLKHFVELDDDYTSFDFRFDDRFRYIGSKGIKDLDYVFNCFVRYLATTPITSIAFAQGGDFIGGKEGSFAQGVKAKRKCMNSFFCSNEKPFQFVGRINEDVNTYTSVASRGPIFLTLNQICLEQIQTQQNAGGMTDIYLTNGTYVKSFYSVIFQPSSVKIKLMQSKFKRLHHSVNWGCTVPKILRESVKKTSAPVMTQ